MTRHLWLIGLITAVGMAVSFPLMFVSLVVGVVVLMVTCVSLVAVAIAATRGADRARGNE